MKNITVMTIFGTRPEAIKMAPLIKELEKCPAIRPLISVTAQHREMLDEVMDIFDIVPDFDLDIMEKGQTLTGVTVKVLEGMEKIFDITKPDIVLVHGDTTTTFAGSLASFYKKITVGHVEAGLRSFDKYAPYPEEINRKLTGVLTDIHFAPTAKAKENLLKEGVSSQRIFVTGNTVIDGMSTTVNSEYNFRHPMLKRIDFKRSKVILLTAHRRENIGIPMENIFIGIREVLDNYRDVKVVYPVHRNPAVKEIAERILGNHDGAILIDPLDVRELHNLMDRCYLVLTDSGGLQEEAPALGKPVLVLRDVTERPEGIEAGTVRLAGTSKEGVVNSITLLLNDRWEYQRMARAVNPYGDGNASKRIVNAILYHFGLATMPPDEFIPIP